MARWPVWKILFSTPRGYKENRLANKNRALVHRHNRTAARYSGSRNLAVISVPDGAHS